VAPVVGAEGRCARRQRLGGGHPDRGARQVAVWRRSLESNMRISFVRNF
jgi:hypothetical protein